MFRLVLPLFALTGCAGSVALEEVDGFGPVASAVWVYYDDWDAHGILLTNVTDACGKMQAQYEAVEEETDVMLDHLGEGDYCEETAEAQIAAARAGDALYHEGAHWLSIELSEDGDSEPDEEEYEVGGDPRVSGLLMYVENSPYAAKVDQFDPESDDAFHCGVDPDDKETDTDSWRLSDGDLEITNVNDEKTVSGRFEGELEESGDGGDSAGDIAFDFTATYCEIG